MCGLGRGTDSVTAWSGGRAVSWALELSLTWGFAASCLTDLWCNQLSVFVSVAISCWCCHQLSVLPSAVGVAISCWCCHQLLVLQSAVSVTISLQCGNQLPVLQSTVDVAISCVLQPLVWRTFKAPCQQNVYPSLSKVRLAVVSFLFFCSFLLFSFNFYLVCHLWVYFCVSLSSTVKFLETVGFHGIT